MVKHATAQPDEFSSRIQWSEDHFWVWVHCAAARIASGELLQAMDAISHLRERILGPLFAERGGAEKGTAEKGRLLEMVPWMMPVAASGRSR